MRKADDLSPSRAVVTKSGSLNFLEPSGPVQACNGTALPFYFLKSDLSCRYSLLIRPRANVAIRSAAKYIFPASLSQTHVPKIVTKVTTVANI